VAKKRVKRSKVGTELQQLAQMLGFKVVDVRRGLIRWSGQSASR
jgi:hypothetical protein